MSILLIGLNHRTAPVDVREQLAFTREGAATALLLFRNQFPRSEAAILSTCNRVEILIATEADRPTTADVVSFIAQSRDLPVAAFRHHLYQLQDEQAIRHFFRVASGLDSMMVGEYQIVNQVKQAYALASEQGTTGRVLNRLFHQALAVSKRVRNETEIGERKVSVPSVAVDIARRIFDDFADKQTLVVGAGEMAQLVCEHLRAAKAQRFTVTTRTLANAKALAEACRGRAVPFDQLDQQLVSADIVVTATSCPKPILTIERMKAIQKSRRGRPVFLIDLAVPRNVEPGVEQLAQVFVYDIDALGRIVAENQQHRIGQVEACEQILDEEIEAFHRWLGESQVAPLIVQMYQDARALQDGELQRLFNRCPDLTDEQRRAVTQLAERIISKFMHPCVSTLRQHHQPAEKQPRANPLHALADALHAVTGKLQRDDHASP
jgi:glutamyl-tRNA reductase